MTAPDGAMAGVVQYDGAQAVDSPPLTSGAPTPTTTVMLPGATGGSVGGNDSFFGPLPEQQTGAASLNKISGALAFGAVLAGAVL